MSNWKFTFRGDQCEFINAAMDYIIEWCEAQASDEPLKYPMRKFCALRTKERAIEIRDQIKETVS